MVFGGGFFLAFFLGSSADAEHFQDISKFLTDRAKVGFEFFKKRWFEGKERGFWRGLVVGYEGVTKGTRPDGSFRLFWLGLPGSASETESFQQCWQVSRRWFLEAPQRTDGLMG